MLPCNISGTSFSIILFARPSAIAVLPTPASPTNKGLFFLRRQSICTTRSTSSSRPINGSIFPSAALAFRFVAKRSNGFGAALSPFTSISGSPVNSLSESIGTFEIPCAIKLTTSSRATSC